MRRYTSTGRDARSKFWLSAGGGRVGGGVRCLTFVAIVAASFALYLRAIFKRLSRARLCPIQGEADGSPLNFPEAYH